MVHYSVLNGRMRYGTDFTRERPHDRGSASSTGVAHPKAVEAVEQPKTDVIHFLLALLFDSLMKKGQRIVFQKVIKIETKYRSATFCSFLINYNGMYITTVCGD